MMPLSDTLARDDLERPALSFPLNKPRDLGNGKENLVVSFDLSKLQVKEGRVIPALTEGVPDGLPNPARQEPAIFAGTVSEINRTGKETTFTLTLGPSQTLTIQAGDATVYYNDGAAPSPALGDGKRVAVRGTLATDSKRVVAQQVEVYADVKPTAANATLRGAVASADPSSGTLTVTATQVEGIVPTLATVTVMLTPDAVLRSDGGLLLTRDQFFGSLPAGRGTLAAVEGAYEPVTGVMKATQAKIEDAVFAPAHEVVIQGTPKEADAATGRFSVAAPTEWQGLSVAAPGKTEGDITSIPVVTTAATAFRDEAGQYLASASFFTAAVAGDKSVRVAGIYADGKLTATHIDLAPPAPKPEATPADDTKATKPADGGKAVPSADKPDMPKADDTTKPAAPDTKPEAPPTKPAPPAAPPKPDEV
jgi:hypothetical protein